MSNNRYTTSDFLQDEKFIRWVVSPTVETELYWQDFMTEDPATIPAIKEAKKIIRSTHFQQIDPLEEEEQEVLTRVLNHQRPMRLRQVESSGSQHSFHWVSWAAVLFLVAGLGIWWITSDTSTIPEMQVETSVSASEVVRKIPYGKKIKITLPDGSIAIVNSGSILRYHPDFNGAERVVYMTGEAFFEVAKNPEKPFIVRSKDLSTVAIGTAFNVKAYPEDHCVTVSLVEGKVAIKRNLPDNTDNLYLSAGEKAIYNPDPQDFRIKPLDKMADLSWKYGTLHFNNASFEEVSKGLERWYGIQIKVSQGNIDHWKYNGTFAKSSLTRTLDRLAYVQNFTYKIKQDTVHLTMNP